ncbi:MAG: hypothetical protein FJ098_16045, partial [Deltaproteobacteria bacterium]|nr:hypothetical protein [Deltaproteobacteria bacterium]
MTIRWVGILALVLSASACGGGGPSQGMDAPGEDGNDQVSSADGAGEDLAAADAGEDGGVICPGGKLCDDDLPCTRDLCREDGACDHELRPGFCLIDGACLEDGEESPEEACLECITAVATEAWTPDDTNGCDDGDPCTVQDRCEGGLCTGTPVACPGDGNPCTAAACQQGACSQVPVDGPCDDGDPCTVGEAC